MEDGMNYQNYTVIDFTLDESFCQWVIRPDEKSDKLWNQWLQHHPHKREEEARNWILLLRSLEGYSSHSQPEIEVALQGIMIKIREKV